LEATCKHSGQGIFRITLCRHADTVKKKVRKKREDQKDEGKKHSLLKHLKIFDAQQFDVTKIILSQF
jgi:hypothetical protein